MSAPEFGRRTLVVGASGSLGSAIALEAAAAGDRLVLTGGHAEGLSRLVDGMPTNEPPLLRVGDVRTAGFLVGLAEAVASGLGGLDRAVFAAGVMRTGGVDTIAEEDLALVLDTNVTGTVLGLRAISPLLGRGASVVLIGSSAGVRPISDFAVYTTSKAAIVHLTQACALDWAARGIRVNCVCPGVVPGPVHRSLAWPDSELLYELMTRATPLGRLGTPEDVARAVTFLSSDDNAWLTGAVLSVDGGLALI